MRLLDRYLLRELLLPLGYCLGGFLVFWISFDLFTELASFQKDHLTVADVAAYYSVLLPQLLVLVLPIVLLLSSLYALTNHARHHELIAIRAAGVGVWRLSVPYLLVGLVFSLVIFVLNEWFVPPAVPAAEAIRNRHSESPSRAGDQRRLNVNFVNARDGRIWNIQEYHLETQEMIRPQVDWQLADGSRRQILAERGARTNGAWAFYDVQELDYYPGQIGAIPSRIKLLVLPEWSETPERIQSEIKINSLDSFKRSKKARLSARDIQTYLEWHPRLRAEKKAQLTTLLHSHFATPWTSLVVVLITLPFGMTSVRRNVFVGVASSIVICFAYFVLNELCLALGAGGYVLPWLAAWLPNLLFGGAGFALTRRLP